MISGVLIVNAKGDVLISRIYRDDLSSGIADTFRQRVVLTKDVRSPVVTYGNTTFMFIQQGGVYVVAVTKQNVNTCMVFETLHKLVELFRDYFGGKFTEDAIQNNFIVIYELLDEVLDFGYPQTTTSDVLKLYITQGGNKLTQEKINKDRLSKITIQATGVTPWRSGDIKHKKNEIYIDVVESVNLLMSAQGNILRADVSGVVHLRCMLSGMPECKLGLNDKLLLDKEARAGKAAKKGTAGIELDDCTFHQCVKLGKFDSDRSISFIPPDGEFDLMKYRTTEHVHLPFRVWPMIKEFGRTRIEAKVSVKSNFDGKMFGTSVKVKVPCPKNTAVCKVHVSAGRAKYLPEVDAIVWKIRRFPGDTEYTMTANIELSASVSLEKKAWSRPPISMEFQVPMFTASGLHVRFLRVVEKSRYDTVKWVRYLTQAGNYLNRI